MFVSFPTCCEFHYESYANEFSILFEGNGDNANISRTTHYCDGSHSIAELFQPFRGIILVHIVYLGGECHCPEYIIELINYLRHFGIGDYRNPEVSEGLND